MVLSELFGELLVKYGRSVQLEEEDWGVYPSGTQDEREMGPVWGQAEINIPRTVICEPVFRGGGFGSLCLPG